MDHIMVLGMIGSIVMPLFNIPLILRIVHRNSSEDISLTWTIGVWVCILLMTPAAFVSQDIVLKVFGVTNLIFFSGVVFTVLRYHHLFKK